MSELRKPSGVIDPRKDLERAHPVSTVWRPLLRRIVQAVAEGNEQALGGMEPTIAVSPTAINDMVASVADYGETVIDLPEETWNSSIAQWMGTHWDVLVDLWTVESGRSDLVLAVRVFEYGGDYRFEVDSIYVP